MDSDLSGLVRAGSKEQILGKIYVEMPQDDVMSVLQMHELFVWKPMNSPTRDVPRGYQKRYQLLPWVPA